MMILSHKSLDLVRIVRLSESMLFYEIPKSSFEYLFSSFVKCPTDIICKCRSSGFKQLLLKGMLVCNNLQSPCPTNTNHQQQQQQQKKTYNRTETIFPVLVGLMT